MNPKKPDDEKVVSSGISINPVLKQQIRKVAKKRGMRLSTFASLIFTEIVKQDALNEQVTPPPRKRSGKRRGKNN